MLHIIDLQELNALLAEKYPGDQVLVRLILTEKGEWVFDSTAQILPGARPHDRFLFGRTDGKFFNVAERDPNQASWGQLEIREEPLVSVPKEKSDLRIIGGVRVEVASSTGRVRVKPSSLSNGQIVRTDDDQTVGFFRTNIARIDGDAEVLKRQLQDEEGDGWKTVAEVYSAGDQRLIIPLTMAKLYP